MKAVGRPGWIQIDCADPVALAGFWSQILGTNVDTPLGDPPHYVGGSWPIPRDEFCLIFS